MLSPYCLQDHSGMKLVNISLLLLLTFPKLNAVINDNVYQLIIDVKAQLHGTSVDVISDGPDAHLFQKLKINLAKNMIFVREMLFEKYALIQKDDGFTNVSSYRPIVFGKGDHFTKSLFQKVINNGPIYHCVWLWLLDDQNHLIRFFDGLNIPFDTLAFAAIPGANDSILVFEVYRIKVNSPLRVTYIAKWTKLQGVNLNHPQIQTRVNLDQFQFKIAAVEFWPVSTFRYLLEPNITVDGYFNRVWMELGSLLNFTQTYIKRFQDESGILENGLWNGFIGKIQKGDIDGIVSELNIDVDRINVLEFLHPLVSSRYQIFYKPPYIPDLSAVFRPLSSIVWMLLVFWIILGGTVFYFVGRFSTSFDNSIPYTEKSLSKYFMVVFQALCNQGNYILPKSASCRIIFLLCYLVPSVIIPSYSASLISSLTQRTPFMPYNSLSDLLNEKVPIMTGRMTAEYAYFRRSSDPIHQKVFEELVEPVHNGPMKNDERLRGYSGAIDIACENNGFALFAVEVSIETRMNLQEYGICNLVKFPQSLSPVYQSIALRRGTTYIHALRYQTLRLFEFGMVARHKRKVATWGSNTDSLQAQRQLDNSRFVKIFDVVEIFLALVGGLVAAIIIFVGEIVCTFFYSPKRF